MSRVFITSYLEGVGEAECGSLEGALTRHRLPSVGQLGVWWKLSGGVGVFGRSVNTDPIPLGLLLPLSCLG